MAKSSTEKLPSVVRETCGTYGGYQVHTKNKEISCVLCRAANATYRAKWYAEHPEKIKAFGAKYYVENRERIKTSNAKHRAANREASNARARRWNARHPEKTIRDTHRRRAQRLGNGHSPYTEAQVLALYGTSCHICHEPIDMKAPRQIGKPGWERGLHMDHVVAVTDGGRDDLENVKPSHGRCNLRKKRRPKGRNP